MPTLYTPPTNSSRASRPRVFRIIIGATIAILLITLGIFIYTRIFSAKLSLVIAPESATVTLNGKPISAGKYEKRVTPGEYTISVEKSGFSSQSRTVKVSADETVEVLIALESNTSETANWYREHEKDAELQQEVYDKTYNQDASAYEEKYPIVADLPSTGRDWSLNYGVCSDGRPFCIFISSSDGAYTYALEYLSTINDHTYNLADYNFEFTDYNNPFPDRTGATSASTADLLSQATNGIQTASVIKTDCTDDNSYCVGFISYYNAEYNNPDEGDLDFYRVLMQRSGSTWKIISPTVLIFSASDHPDLPGSVLTLANQF